jgi:hypothetical protein
MADNQQKRNPDKYEQEIRSPRSAAIAGFIFSGLLIFQMVLAASIGADMRGVFRRDLLAEWLQVGDLILGAVPFAGIAFLWFTGVIRDWLGDREDRFFSTVFFGSGILYVAMLFVYAAVMGAVLGTYALADKIILDNDVLIFGYTLVNEILANYALRMAAVYMFSIGSLLTRTGRAPRWLVILTFLVAAGFLIFAGTVRWARYIFPGWVILISLYILVENYRQGKNDQSEQGNLNEQNTSQRDQVDQ